MDQIQHSKPVPPFVRFCAANIPMVFDDSLSYYEALCALWKWLQTDVIDVINNNASVTENYIEFDLETRQLFIELKEYVDNYFDNLDVQEEINNKLDAMVEDGTLNTIIGSYVDTYVADTNHRLDEMGSEIAGVEYNLGIELPQYKPIKFTQALSIPFPRNTSVQGFCVDDDNNVYIYVPTTGQYGDLYKYSLPNHTYIGKFENKKLHHGNDMVYKNGKIYVAPVTADDGTNTNKSVDVYDVTTGNVSVISPFADADGARVECICDFDATHILVGMCEYTDSSNTVDMHIYKLDLNTYDYVEIDTQWFAEVEPSRVISMCYINGKIYISADDPEYIFEMYYDEENQRAINTRIYSLSKENDLGLPIGEIEGIKTLPSGLYGDNTFAMSAFNITNGVGGLVNYTVYLSNLKSDLVSYMGERDDSNIMNHITDLHVKASGTNLLENGSSTYPFHDINYAVEYANKLGINYLWIVLDDSETYQLGAQADKNIRIKAKDGTVSPTVKISRLTNCNTYIYGTTIGIEKSTDADATFYIDGGKFIVEGSTIKACVYSHHGAELFFNGANITINYDHNNIIESYCTHAILSIGTIGGTGTTTRLLRITEGSVFYLNHAHAGTASANWAGTGSQITYTAS